MIPAFIENWRWWRRRLLWVHQRCGHSTSQSTRRNRWPGTLRNLENLCLCILNERKHGANEMRMETDGWTYPGSWSASVEVWWLTGTSPWSDRGGAFSATIGQPVGSSRARRGSLMDHVALFEKRWPNCAWNWITKIKSEMQLKNAKHIARRKRIKTHFDMDRPSGEASRRPDPLVSSLEKSTSKCLDRSYLFEGFSNSL